MTSTQQQAAKRDETVFGLLNDAAEHGRACPTNQALADHFNYATTEPIITSLHRLMSSGKIEVERLGPARTVTICATGKKTATTRPNTSIEIAAKIFPLYRDAADHKKPAPENTVLAKRFGVSPTTVAAARSYLVANGMIRINRRTRPPIVEIVATGKRTSR